MNIVIRADASLLSGSGHLMRCLTLANELRKHGHRCIFVCRRLQGNLLHLLAEHQFEYKELPPNGSATAFQGDSEYATWLGVPMEVECRQMQEIMQKITRSVSNGEPIDWIIVDHYGLDAVWQETMRPFTRGIFAIDDIANRPHRCDILLDQNLYNAPEQRYKSRVLPTTRLLLGPEYALLREEFQKARQDVRPRTGVVKNILVFFGGVDSTNETAKTLRALAMLRRSDIAIHVIVGVANPHNAMIEQLCATIPNCFYHCQVPNMADFMRAADMSIGAGGSTTWERCALGLPTLAVICADNQRELAQTAHEYGILQNLGYYTQLQPDDIAHAIEACLENPALLQEMSHRAASFVDARGVMRIRQILEQERP